MRTLLRLTLLIVIAVAAAAPAPTSAQRGSAPKPDGAAARDARRADFLQRFARAYYPGRSGQLMIVPREGEILTRPEADIAFMHGSPWPYDANIPILFAGPQVTPGAFAAPAAQQDVAVTVAAALGRSMPATASGRVLPVFRAAAKPPRAAFILVLDGMRRDYFINHAQEMPVLTALRKRGAWFTNARVNYLPTNTASGHSTISTGADPRVHGVNGNNLLDSATRKRHDMYSGWEPRHLMALTIADVWQLETRGRAIVIAQGGNPTSSTALAGHGACQLSGVAVFHAAYDETSGTWKTNPQCFKIVPELATLDARTLLPADGLWMGHKIDSASSVRRSGLFPRFEADAFIRAIETQPIGQDEVPDLLLMNLKSADYVGHKHGPGAKEMAATLAEIDRAVARILAALEKKIGNDYLLAITADHGMPGEPAGDRRRHYAPEIVDLMNTRFDPEQKAVVTYYEPENSQIFVDMERLAALRLTLADLAAFLREQIFINAVFTEEDVRRAAARLR